MMSDLFNSKQEAERLPQNMDVLEHIKWVINECHVKCTKYSLSQKFNEILIQISTLKSRSFASSVVNFLDQAP